MMGGKLNLIKYDTLTPGMEAEPTTYYGRRSGIGYAMTSVSLFHGATPAIGVVGLGTGTLSCYAQPGQDWRFFEIDPAIVRIAGDRSRFTFLSRCAPQARVVRFSYCLRAVSYSSRWSFSPGASKRERTK